MSRIKEYFKKEFSKDMFLLNHDSVQDFYLICCQRNRSPVPMLLVRTIICTGCVGILIASMVIMTQVLNFGTWFIFLTHWGLLMNTLNSIFALFISLRAMCGGFKDGGMDLPWYVKAYWMFYNLSIPLAFFITIFYFALLTDFGDTYGINPVLDVFIHGINSVLMLALIVASRHPTRLLHFYWTLCFGVIYLIFTVIYHFSGALSPFGTSWIYPMIDWNDPGPTIGYVVASAVGLVVMHIVVVGITLIRNALTRSCKEPNKVYLSDDRY